jgi:hypothetical protein
MKVLAVVAGAALGAAAGWLLPGLLIPDPHEFERLAVLGWRAVLTPVGALAGLLIGVLAASIPPRP